MPELIYDPPLLARPKDQPFIQRIDLRENGEIIASIHWHAPAGSQGVVQLLDLTVAPAHHRLGHGSALLSAAIAQIAAAGRLRRIPVRRIWMSVEQKTQVHARAFLTRHGFHHIATAKDLLRDQDALIYVRSLD